MNRILTLCVAITLTLFAPASKTSAQTATDPNEGLQLEIDPNFVDGYTLRWWGHPGRVYFIENSANLGLGSWLGASFLIQGQNTTEQLDFLAQGARVFTRLKAFDGVLDPFSEDRDYDGIKNGEEARYGSTRTNPIAYSDRDSDDDDLDGIPDAFEWTYLKTLSHTVTDEYDPTSAPGATALALYQSLRPDQNGNGLPDDWERQRLGAASEDNDTPENVAWFRSDRVMLTRHRYGSHVFTYDSSEPRNPFYWDGTTSTDLRQVYLRSDLGGTMIATYADTTYQILQSLRIYPSHPNYGSPTGAYEEPPIYYADYTGTENGGLWTYAYNAPTGTGGFIARDLLGTADGRPWRRTDTGARQPARIAITSLPVTQTGPNHFPLVLRDFPYGNAAFPDFPASSGVSDNAILEPILDGPPYRGRPMLKLNPKADRSILNRHTFSQWYRHNDAFGYTTSQLLESTDTCPPGFIYGVYQRAFRPQIPDVNPAESFARSLFTAELSMRLDYNLAQTELYIQADDVAWVFIDGRLAIDSIDPFTYGNRWLLSDLKQYVEARDGSGTGFLAASTGTCKVDIFYADTRPYDTRFVAMANSPMKPVYVYQVVAETELDAALSYSLLTAPPGMEIDSATGRIVWDFHALNTDSNPSNDIASGVFPVTVQVTDPLGRTDTQSFDLVITL